MSKYGGKELYTNEYEDDIVFASFINYMKIILLIMLVIKVKIFKLLLQRGINSQLPCKCYLVNFSYECKI